MTHCPRSNDNKHFYTIVKEGNGQYYNCVYCNHIEVRPSPNSDVLDVGAVVAQINSLERFSIIYENDAIKIDIKVDTETIDYNFIPELKELINNILNTINFKCYATLKCSDHISFYYQLSKEKEA